MSEWQEVKLEDICKFKYGKMPPENVKSDSGFPIYTGYRISGYANQYLYKDSMLIVVARGVGGTGDVKISPEQSWITNLSIVLEVDHKKADKYFLMNLLSQSSLKERFDSGSAQSQITIDSLSNLKISLPPLPTQQKIAKILSNYDDLIENNLKRIKLLEESARLTYEEWFLRFRIDGKKLDIDPETSLPFGWEKRKLVSLCENFTDGTHDSPKQTDETDSYYLITGKHLADNKIDFSTAYKISESDFLNISKRSGLRKNDILFSNIGTLGYVAMVGKFIEFSCKNVFIFRPLKDVNCYLFEFLKYEQNKNNFIAQSSGAAQKFISLQFMRSFETAVAPITTLHEFNKIVSDTYLQIDNLQYQNQLLKEARDILLPRLMTGMIDTDDIGIAV